MLDSINNTFKNNEYYVVLYNKNVYIYNYSEILHFSENLILIDLKKCKLEIKGDNLLIKRMEKIELLIEGIIFGVSYE